MPRVQPGPRKGPSPDTRTVPDGVWEPRLHLWIDISGRGSLGPGKLRLLAAIAATGSLAAAAKKLRMSYRLAWKHLREIEERTGLTVAEPQRGGRRGGGTTLTPQGQALIETYGDFRREVEQHTRAAFDRHFADCSAPRQAEPNA